MILGKATFILAGELTYPRFLLSPAMYTEPLSCIMAE